MVFKKLLLSVCVVATLSVAAADDALARDKLRVGTEPTFAPFEFMDTQTREFVGYDIDLIRAVADKAGYDIEVVNMGFDALIPALGMGVVDVVAAGVTITEERSKRVDFTAPYYTAGLSMLVRKEDAAKYPDFKSLENQAIAVQIGTTGADKAKDIPGAKVTNYNATSEPQRRSRGARSSRACLLHEDPAAYVSVSAATAGNRRRAAVWLCREEGQQGTP